MHVSYLVSTLKPDANVLIIKQFIIIIELSYRNIASDERFKMYTYLIAFQRMPNNFYDKLFLPAEGKAVYTYEY
jgi:hypothetical protein